MAIRIFLDDSNAAIYRKLVEGNKAVFADLTDLLALCACIGFQEDRRERLLKQSQEAVHMSHPAVDAIAFVLAAESERYGDQDADVDADVHTDAGANTNVGAEGGLFSADAEGADDREDLDLILSEYVNGGAELLKARLTHSAGPVIDSLLELIQSYA
ncbi:MAG: hypothetical protein LBU58_06055 [Clostridiales bacterium]|jgi:hypothetical protein|nr:hypothetical protein [Clostridiales bacterium]